MWELLPLNVRIFLQSLYGEQSPITEKDLNRAEIDALKKIGDNRYINFPKYYNANSVELAKILNPTATTQTLLRKVDDATAEKYIPSKQINYADYSIAPDTPGWLGVAGKTISDPRYRIATTLGNFGMEDRGDHYRAYDTYTWNGDFKEAGGGRLSTLNDIFGDENKGFREQLIRKPTLLFNALAEIFAPQVDRKVDIKIPK